MCFVFPQVTPGANTDGDLSTSRTSEPALLTPLTPSSRGTPSEDGTRNELVNLSFTSPEHVTSLPDSPSSPLDRNFSLQSPFKSDQAFISPLQGILPASLGTDSNGADMGLVEGLQWETATPSLPQRHATRTDLASGEKTSSVLTMSNGLPSPALYSTSSPLLENYVFQVPGSSQTPASLSGFDKQGGWEVYNNTYL